MLKDVLDRVLGAFGHAMLMMAQADDDYWYARTRLADAEAARAFADLDRGVEHDEPTSWTEGGEDAVLEAEWLLASARADDAVSAA